MKNRAVILALIWLNAFGVLSAQSADSIPLPEHPRPDFERAAWSNLNGTWQFRADAARGAESAGVSRETDYPERITVPFPWGSKLSGVPNKADVSWYRRSITVPEAWKGMRVFVVVGASDWITKGWLDGQPLGEHRGGYTPFEFELTSHVQWGREQSFVARVDDTPHAFKLEGKQGYGDVKGIWQTVYLEARPPVFLRSIHFSPDVRGAKVTVRVKLSDAAPAGARLRLHAKTGAVADVPHAIEAGAVEAQFDVPITDPHLWTLEDPFLYELDTVLEAGGAEDRVATYFGMRTISTGTLPGTDIPYVMLNDKPVYLQLTLDQSYHPDGFYTFPTDAFMRDEIVRSKQLGLNGNRIHIKVEVPRKLYWADRLGLLIMADVPNFWGDPTPEARRESEYALREMLERDFNHPAIFSWVTFNETWGLGTLQPDGKKLYLPETQQWVTSIYRLAKQLDPTRLVEDNSPCNHDHTETDLNSWHDYLPGYLWRDRLDQVSRDTFPGSTWNFIGGRTQRNQPMFNSECGNVWGYDGSTGDVDWTWDYHIMMNEFRRHPKVAGWLYTEHHDVINEWNGYYRFDRSEKFTGLESFVPEMTLKDFHSPFYISTGSELCRDVAPGQTVEVPLYASFLTSEVPDSHLVVRSQLHGWDALGQVQSYSQATQAIECKPWMSHELAPLEIKMPDVSSLAVLSLSLETPQGVVLHRNFTTFLVAKGTSPRSELREHSGVHERVLRFAPNTFTAAQWSDKQWNVLDGLKVNGAGHGYFEYHVPWPADLDAKSVTDARLVFEASAKQLLGKDKGRTTTDDGDYMRGAGKHDPGANPNAYPMTDTTTFPTDVRVRINGVAAGVYHLPDDPADHRGVLSWHAQLRDKKLHEAGSYGYLVEAPIPLNALNVDRHAPDIVIRFEVDEALAGGLALYGERFGRYPLDPTIVLTLR